MDGDSDPLAADPRFFSALVAGDMKTLDDLLSNDSIVFFVEQQGRWRLVAAQGTQIAA